MEWEEFYRDQESWMRRVGLSVKCQQDLPCDRRVLCLHSSSGCKSIHSMTNYHRTVCTHIVPMSASWLKCHNIVRKDITFGENQGKSTQDLPIQSRKLRNKTCVKLMKKAKSQQRHGWYKSRRESYCHSPKEGICLCPQIDGI